MKDEIVKVGNAHVYYQSIREDRATLVQTLCNAMMMFPYMRLGQLLENAVPTFIRDIQKLPVPNDLFYVEDDVVQAALEWYVREFAGDPLPSPEPSPYERNREGYEDRVKNFELNVMDWQLYSSMEGVGDAVEQLNRALHQACDWHKPNGDWQAAQEYVYEKMDELIEFGARDTEPEVALCDFLAYHFPKFKEEITR